MTLAIVRTLKDYKTGISREEIVLGVAPISIYGDWRLVDKQGRMRSIRVSEMGEMDLISGGTWKMKGKFILKYIDFYTRITTNGLNWESRDPNRSRCLVMQLNC